MNLRDESGLVVVPGSRYTSREFFDLEMEKLWPRVWQVACREEEVPNPGDYLEYTIGDQSVLVLRSDTDTIMAFFNACPHRGTRLAAGTGNMGPPEIRCRYHGWRWRLDGGIVEVIDRHQYPASLTDACVSLGEVQVGRWGGFVFINMDPHGEAFGSFIGSIPEVYSTYRFENLRFRSYRTILFECNWKVAIDAFNEGYHPQALHPQMLTWFNDTLFVYEQLGKHSRYGSPDGSEQEMGPSPRLGLKPEDFDEAELLADRVDAIAGLFPRSDQALLQELKRNGPPPGKTVPQVFKELRLKAMHSRGYDLTGLTDDDLLGAGTIHLFPNLVGPISHGNATLYRARPNGLDPNSTILDYWALEWVPIGADPPSFERKFYQDWSLKNWGLINNQDFGNIGEVTRGLQSRGFRGALLNPVQEANLVHHQRMIDEYVTD
jgi:phenylpropionate dioxygenase-like ring-hydroxylating dioxygenase large terminal subunit